MHLLILYTVLVATVVLEQKCTSKLVFYCWVSYVCYCSQLHITTPSDHVSYSFTPLITSLFILNCSCVESQTEKYVNRQWEPFWTLQRTPKLVLGLGFLVEFKYFLVSVPISQILNSFRVIKSLKVIDTCTVEEDQGKCKNYCFPDLPFCSLQAISDFNERKARVNYSH